jgi:hypothetical protein
MGCYELNRLWGSVLRMPPGRILGRALPALTVFAAPFILYLHSPTSSAGGPLIWRPAPVKAFFALAPFLNYSLAFDLLTGIAVAALVVWAVARHWLLLPRFTAIALAVFGAAYLILPFAVKGGTFFDTRFAVTFGYLIFSGLREARLPGRRVAVSVAAGFLLLFGARIGLISVAWRQQTGQVAQMREAIRPVPPGSRVLVATVIPPEPAGYWNGTPLVRRIGGLYVADMHMPALLLIERHAFWQLFFTVRSQQPIAILPPYDQSAMPDLAADQPRYQLLEKDWQKPEVQKSMPYLKDWPSKFDFVLVLNAGGMPGRENFLSPRLSLLTDTDVAALYRINRADGAGSN